MARSMWFDVFREWKFWEYTSFRSFAERSALLEWFKTFLQGVELSYDTEFYQVCKVKSWREGDLLELGLYFTMCTFHFIAEWTLIVIAFLLNSSQSFLLYRQRKSLKANQVIVASFCIADIVYIFTVSIHHTLTFTKKLDERPLTSAGVGTICNSVLHLGLLTGERLIAVRKPFWHRVYVTPQRTVGACAVIWITSVALAMVLALVEYFVGKGIFLIYIYIAIIMVTSSTVMILVSYVYIFYIVNGKCRYEAGKRKSANSLLCVRGKKRSERKTLAMTSAICISYVFLSFPTVIVFFVLKNGSHHRDLKEWTKLLYIVQCSWDSLIYFWINRKKNCPSHNSIGWIP